MKISKYFTLDEMIVSSSAARYGIDNSPTSEHLANLVKTCIKADAVREYLGFPMIVTSGYRSEALNKVIKGSKTSSHMRGEAIDFRCPGFGTTQTVFNALKKSGIKFDQLILEYPSSPNSWVHIGFGERMRGEFLTFDGKTYTKEQ